MRYQTKPEAKKKSAQRREKSRSQVDATKAALAEQQKAETIRSEYEGIKDFPATEVDRDTSQMTDSNQFTFDKQTVAAEVLSSNDTRQIQLFEMQLY